jgi:hypothetical protein
MTSTSTRIPPARTSRESSWRARLYLGSIQVTTDAAGHAAFDAQLNPVTERAPASSATATDPRGNTSEFSQRIIFSFSPASGPADGGTGITVFGTDFADPSVLTIGGASASVTFTHAPHAEHDVARLWRPAP